MKKSLLFTIMCSVTLISCNREFEIYENPTPVSQAEINAHAESIFGIKFNPNQDWCMTTNGKVTLTINTPELKDVAKVQILTAPPFGSTDCNGAVVLNQKDVNYGETVTINYDAPKSISTLYAACVMKDGQHFIQGFNVGESKVVFEPTTVSQSNGRTRAMEDYITNQLNAISSEKLVIAKKEASFNNTYYQNRAKYSIDDQNRLEGWGNDYLYSIDPTFEEDMLITLNGYTDSYTNTLSSAFDAYLPNKVNNLDKIRHSNFSTYENYPLTTGDDPIILAPVFKNDSIYKEITYCDLYYYYFKESDLKNATDPVQFIKDLPKYKAVDLKYAVKNSDESYQGQGLENREVKRFMGLALVFWGDGTPDVGTTGTFNFPRDYKIGFLTRSRDSEKNVAHDKDKRQGELYGDNRMNAFINFHGHFASSGLGEKDPRMAWFWCNNLAYLMCETGSDADFNDMVYQVIGGVLPPPPNDPDVAEYLFCFEDRSLGDYDLNDVVIKGTRLDETHVKWTLMATGANDELYIQNIKDENGEQGQYINNETEVHKIFGSDERVFINTVKGGLYKEPVSETFVVNKDFSFLDPFNQPYIKDMTTGGNTIYLAKRGEDPHAIMVPCDLPEKALAAFYEGKELDPEFNPDYKEFYYPLEKVCVKDAYLNFNDWGAENSILSTVWYMYPEMDKVYVFPSTNP